MKLLTANEPGQIDEAIGLLQSTVFSFSMKVCGHREDAEDTMQEVLFKSIPYLSKIEDPHAMAVWLYTVTQNQCRMAHRKSKFAPTHTMTLDALLPDEDEMANLLADSSPSPEASAISHQADELVQRAVLQIPPKYRLILVLHDMEDLDTAEIAKITSLKEGTVRVRLHRARLLVRRELTQERIPTAAKKTRKKSAPSRRTQACQEMFANLSEYLDHRIDTLTCEEMQKHIEGCPACVAFIRDLERVVERCRNFSVSCSPTTAETLRRILKEQYLSLVNGEPAKFL
jgi:RNA polymerase sigma-70 factor (ECF subfamily)